MSQDGHAQGSAKEMGEAQAYVTLVMTDSYLPGAVVLAHSLRDSGTQKLLAVLITPDTLSADTIDTLRELYDHVIPVSRTSNPRPENLTVLARPDLLYTFTKIELFNLTNFSKLVYLDADVVALRAPDELFDLPVRFAAAPDIGWPDAFNSGVMVIAPDNERYTALREMASQGRSFDGADQGLLNEYFEKEGWHRLSFTYNCTPNAEYQWEPAYRHYKDRISLVHFIGKQKPWNRSSWAGSGVYRELLGRWWLVKQRHPDRVSRKSHNVLATSTPVSTQSHSDPPKQSTTSQEGGGHEATPETPPNPVPEPTPSKLAEEDSPEPEVPVFCAPEVEWDPTKSAPPIYSKPEAENFPTQLNYTFAQPPSRSPSSGGHPVPHSGDHGIFQAPASYPPPPKNMWYEVPEVAPDPVDAEPRAIFPWEKEGRALTATRVWAEDWHRHVPAPEPQPEPTAGHCPGFNHRDQDGGRKSGEPDQKLEPDNSHNAPVMSMSWAGSGAATRSWSPQPQHQWPPSEPHQHHHYHWQPPMPTQHQNNNHQQNIEDRAQTSPSGTSGHAGQPDYADGNRGRTRFRQPVFMAPQSPPPTILAAKPKRGIQRAQTPFVKSPPQVQVHQPKTTAVRPPIPPPPTASFKPLVNAWDTDPVIRKYIHTLMTRHDSYHVPVGISGTASETGSVEAAASVSDSPRPRGFKPSYPSFRHFSNSSFSRDRGSGSSTKTAGTAVLSPPAAVARDLISDSPPDILEVSSPPGEVASDESIMGPEDVDVDMANLPLRKLARRRRRRESFTDTTAVDESWDDASMTTVFGHEEDAKRRGKVNVGIELQVLTCPSCGFSGKKNMFC